METIKITEQFTDRCLTCLKAPEGKYLTQSSEETTDAQRVYCTEVALAVNASPSDWREATAEEKEDFEAAQLAAMEAQINSEMNQHE